MNKLDLELPDNCMQSNIKIGSKVVFVDGSYTMSMDFPTSKLEHRYVGLSNDIYTVVDINKPFPTGRGSVDSLSYQNNCMVISERTMEIVFCSRINIRNIKWLGDDAGYRLRKVEKDEKVFVVDNSYTFDKETGKEVGICLAGTVFSEPKPVKVVSAPYMRNHEYLFGKRKDSEFIDVEYQGKVYGVLNNITKTKRDHNLTMLDIFRA